MKYMIVSAESTEELESRVMSYISDGWAPSGGLCVRVGTVRGQEYSQAMVKMSSD